MNEIRARYIQDEREDARKEGKIEGKIEERKQVITNMLNRRHKFYSQNDQISAFRNN